MEKGEAELKAKAEKPECGVLNTYIRNNVAHIVVPDECKKGYSSLESLGVRVLGEAEANDGVAQLRREEEEIDARLDELKRREDALRAEEATRREETPPLTAEQVRQIARQEARRAAEAMAVVEDEDEAWAGDEGEEFNEDEFTDLDEA